MPKSFATTLLSPEDQQLLGEIDESRISPKVWHHAEHPRNVGTLQNPDGQAEVTGMCEDTIAFQLCVRDGMVDQIRFRAKGCGFTLACGSMATELAHGKSFDHALGITGQDIETALGGLPRGHIHCADLAANALQGAVRNALDSRRSGRR
jgi:nitrogen fixation NifU-like protein